MSAASSGAPRPLTRREERFNTWLTVALLLGIAVAGNLLASRRLAARRDLSADQLYAVAPVTERVLGGLEDRLQVRTYFTRETELGEVALGRARIEAQLREFEALGRGKIEVVHQDPVTSSAARADALRAGVRPVPWFRQRGTERVEEDVWLGLVLRYRGRDQVIPVAQAWRFEVQFASAVHALTRDRRVVVGFVNAPAAPPAGATGAAAVPGWPTFGALTAELDRAREPRAITGLAEGVPVPADVDVLVVIGSEWLHPRAVFELDRFVQRGGALIAAVDDPVFNWVTGYPRDPSPESPLVGPLSLGALLRKIGADVRRQHVWDPEWPTVHAALRASGAGRPEVTPVRSSAVITVPEEGLDADAPPTRDLKQLTLYWAHPIVDAGRFPPPPGVRRIDLVRTSPRARLLGGLLSAIPVDPKELAALDVSLRTEPFGSYVLAAAFTGDLPSLFAGAPVPEARAPLSGADATAVVPVAPLPPEAKPGTVVVVGDADWLRDPGGTEDLGVLLPFARGGGALFLENLVDWLTLDDDLIALRSRVPRERPLVDFEREAEVAAGLDDVDPYPTEAERVARDAKRDEARRDARWRRWRTILAPIGAALAVVLALGVAWNRLEARRPGGGRR